MQTMSLQKQKCSLLTKGMVLAFALAATLALTLGLAGTAHAATVPWNDKVMVEAYAVDPTYADNAQTINVKMTFSQSIDFSSDEVEEDELIGLVSVYLQNSTSIAGNAINGATYNRAVSDVVVGDKVITFKIGPNAAGMTANYNGKLTIAANADISNAIASAMGGAAVETLIDNGISVSKVSSSDGAAVFSVDTRAQARAMNHVLITDVIDGKETAIFTTGGTFSNGGITIHSHTFMNQQVADYAASIVAAGNTAADSEASNNYTFVDNGNGQFAITNGGADCSNIKVYMYDCEYLNSHGLAVGEIWEPIWSED